MEVKPSAQEGKKMKRRGQDEEREGKEFLGQGSEQGKEEHRGGEPPAALSAIVTVGHNYTFNFSSNHKICVCGFVQSLAHW